MQLAILLGSSVVAFALAYLLARRVQRQIASPLLNLVDTMQAAERGDYSKRAQVTSDDEIGHLMRGFNVHARADREPRAGARASSRSILEAQVVERTKSLAEANKTLRQAMNDSVEACRIAEAAARQERIPGAHVARDPHADERRARHDRAAARFEARSAPAPLRGHHPELGRRAAGHHQRHSRLLEDRGRQAAPRSAGSRHPPGGRGSHRPVRAARAPERHRAAARHRPVPASLGQGRRAAHPPDPHEPGVERAQVHRQRPRAGARARRESFRDARVAGHRRGRHGHGHPAGEPGGDLRRLRAGRRLDHAPLRRHGTGAGDQPPARHAHGRRHHGGQPAGRGFDVLAGDHAAGRAGHRLGFLAGPACSRRARACWWSTTAPSMSRSSRSQLEAWGFIVTTAASAMEAQTHLERDAGGEHAAQDHRARLAHARAERRRLVVRRAPPIRVEVHSRHHGELGGRRSRGGPGHASSRPCAASPSRCARACCAVPCTKRCRPRPSTTSVPPPPCSPRRTNPCSIISRCCWSKTTWSTARWRSRCCSAWDATPCTPATASRRWTRSTNRISTWCSWTARCPSWTASSPRASCASASW